MLTFSYLPFSFENIWGPGISEKNNLRSPALAVEISPTTGDVAQVSAQGYQQMICAALANALASLAPSLRPNPGARR